MKVGDMIEVSTGHTGIIVDVEYMYPSQQRYSPLRNVEVYWNSGMPNHSFNMQTNKNISSINVFAVKKVVSRGD